MALLDIPFRNLQRESGTEERLLQLEHFVNRSPNAIDRVARARRTIERAMPSIRVWQALAREHRRFYDGHQWDPYDKMLMEQSRRPALTYNDVKKIIRGICGMERFNRTEARFVTKPIDSSYVEDLMGDLATEACVTIDDLSDAPYERSLVFRDGLISGMGWYEVKMSFDDDEEGRVAKEHLPNMEMLWDIHSIKSSLQDTRWRARRRNMPKEEFARRWPDKIDMVDAATPDMGGEWTVEQYRMATPYYSLANEQANPQVGASQANRNTIPVIQFQERVDVPVYKIPDPDSRNGLLELSKPEYEMLRNEFRKDGITLPPTVRQIKTRHRQFFMANGVELEEPIDLPGNQFTLLCMTGEWDEEKKIWVGMVGEILDPQKTKNKALSAALSFYLSNAKGGVLFETGAFVNEPQAKEQWSSPAAWVPLNEGALRDKKIQPRVPADMPPSLLAFFQIATKSITDLPGISEEMLGLGQSEMSDPTQRSRVSAGLAILGWIFDEFDRFKKEEAMITLEFIREFMTNGQLIEIGGDEEAQSIPLLKSNLPIKYRLQLDQSIRHNPNLKAQIWRDLMPIIPSLLRFGAGPALLALLKFSPLPAQVVRNIQTAVTQNPPDPTGGRGKKEPPELVAAKVEKTTAEAQKAIAQAKALDAESQAKVAELFLQGFRLTSDMVHRADSEKHSHEMDQANLDIEQAKLENERRNWSVEVLKMLSSLIPDEKNEKREKGSED